MKSTVLFLAIAALSSSAFAAAKPCEELKSEIVTKLDKGGVKGYTLDVVANDKAGDAKIVGSCEGGTKKITYVKK